MENNIFSSGKLDVLWQNVKSYRSSENYWAIMKACSRFRNLAPYNAMLVEIQRPGARYVLTEREWRNKYNRGIKLNARPIIVLAPFGPVDYLFEIDDTYSLPDSLFDNKEEILEQLAHPYKTKINVSEEWLDAVVRRLAFHSIAFDCSLVSGADYGARIELLEKGRSNDYPIDIYLGNRGYLRWCADYLLSVNKNAENGERLASICHELGHLLCQHLQAPKAWKQWGCRILSRSAEEFEAESVSWLVCERLGIGNPSEKYLCEYLENNQIPEGVSMDRILSAAKEVWRLCNMSEPFTYKDGLLFKFDKGFGKM